jgi:hypothetical protein
MGHDNEGGGTGGDLAMVGIAMRGGYKRCTSLSGYSAPLTSTQSTLCTLCRWVKLTVIASQGLEKLTPQKSKNLYL